MIMDNKINQLSDEQFIQLIKNSRSIAEVLFKLDYTIKGNSWGYGKIKQRMIDLNLSPNDFKGKNYLKNTTNTISKEKLFSENSKHSRNTLRRWIIKENLIPYKCSCCGITNWQNKSISLEIDHINGKNNDNRLENLRWLCPNCHSQTSTYGSKNNTIVDKDYEIPKNIIENIITTYKKYKNLKKVSAILGYKRKIVRKVIIDSELYSSNQKYVIRLNENLQEIKRYGSLTECAEDLIKNKEVKTTNIKTCKRSIIKNKDTFWLNSFWKVLDAYGIINNP